MDRTTADSAILIQQSRRSLGIEHNHDEKERPEEWNHPQMTATRLREGRGGPKAHKGTDMLRE